MFTVNISFDASTRLLSDDRSCPKYYIGTIGDNDTTRLVFNVAHSELIPQGSVGRVEFDVWVKDESGKAVYKPYLLLDEHNSVLIPGYILQAVKKYELAIQLAYSDELGTTMYSFNKLVYNIANAVQAIDCESEAVPDVMLAYVQVTFDPETKVMTFIRLNGSTTDVSLEALRGDSFDYEWEGTSLVVKVVDYKGDVIAQSDPVNLLGDSLTFSWEGTTLTVTQVNNAGEPVGEPESVNLLGDSLRASFNGTTTLTVEQVRNDGEVVATTEKNLLGDSLRASFNGTYLTVEQVDNAGNVVDSDTQNLQGPQGLPAESTTPGEFVIRYIGDGLSTEFDVIHNLGTMHPFWQVQDLSGAYPEYVQVYGYAVSGSALHLVFSTPPAVNSIAVLLSSGMGKERTKFEYDQLEDSKVWVINHGLGRKTSFTITDSAGTVIWCDETIVDNYITIETFGIPTKGHAIER